MADAGTTYLFTFATSETPTDPNIVHVKCSQRRLGIIPERFVEEPRLDLSNFRTP